MTMVTRCPSCGTTFRVRTGDLQAHRGQVRCGRCATVFDGFGTLATLPDATPAEPSSTPITTMAPDRAVEFAPGEATLANAEAQSAAAEPVAASVTEALVAEPGPAPLAAPEPPSVGLGTGVRAAITPTPLVAAVTPDTATDEISEFVLPTESPKRRSALWVVGVLVLTLGGAGQGVYFYRNDLAATYPKLRPVLERLCEPLRCALARPSRPRAIVIEASDMQAADPGRPGLVVLTATLRNHAGIDVAFPALDIVLTNTKDHTLARRIFLPAEYLEPNTDVRAGISASAEITVRLQLDTGDLGAAGFRLDLLPAPEE